MLRAVADHQGLAHASGEGLATDGPVASLSLPLLGLKPGGLGLFRGPVRGLLRVVAAGARDCVDDRARVLVGVDVHGEDGRVADVIDGGLRRAVSRGQRLVFRFHEVRPVDLEARLWLVVVPVDPEAVRLLAAAGDVHVGIVPGAAAGVAPVPDPRVLVAVRPGDRRVGDADGVVVGRKEGVGRLLVEIVLVGNFDVAEATVRHLARVDRQAQEHAVFVPKTDIGQVAASVLDSAFYVEADADSDHGADDLRGWEVDLEKLYDAQNSGQDTDCFND